MGDSPERLRITVGGDGHGVRVFSEEFILQRELVDTGISKYYTWDYSGDKYFEISDLQCKNQSTCCLLYTSPSPRDRTRSRMPSSA